MTIRNRITELRHVRAGDLAALADRLAQLRAYAELTTACYVDYFTVVGATRTVDGSANIIPPRREPADGATTPRR